MELLRNYLRRGLAAFAIIGQALAVESKISRSGAVWSQTIAAEESVPPAGKLKISAQGSISVGGDGGSSIRYEVTKTVKAGTEAEARRLLSRFLLKVDRQGDTTYIRLAHGADGSGSAMLRVLAPRGLREAILQTQGGPVEATDLNGAVQITTGGGGIKLDRIGGNVKAKTAGGEVVLGHISGSVHCTSAGGPIHAETIRGEAWLDTAGGEILAREIGGPLHASTAGGGIRAVRAGSLVAANTAGGAIEVGSAKGMVTADSSGGSIRIGAAAGVRCNTGGGAIRLSNVSGSLQASTAVGNVIAELLAGGVPGDSFLTTGGGDITVFLPSNLGIRILAQLDSAQSIKRIASEFPAVKVKMEGRTAVAEGAINGGGPLLRLTGTGGSIYIRKQK